MRQLVDAARGMTGAQLASLPEHHRPIMRMLRELDGLQHGHGRGPGASRGSEADTREDGIAEHAVEL